MEPLLCPDCRTTLQERKLDPGAAWICKRCKGLSLNLAVLRTQVRAEVARAIWIAAVKEGTPSARRCPSCSQCFEAIRVGTSPTVEIDVCKFCQLLWFDLHELVTLGGRREPTLSFEARKAVALAELEVAKEAIEIAEQAEAVVKVLAAQIWPHPLMAAHFLRK